MALALGLLASANGQAFSGSMKLECGYRKLALENAKAAQPWLTHAQTIDIFEALELETECGESPPPDTAAALPAAADAIDAARSVFVESSERGGVQLALAELRASGGKKDTIVLNHGVHFLNDTLTLGADDSGTTITAAPGADAWLSGGQPLGKLAWERVDHPSGGSVWAASLKDVAPAVESVPGLFTTATHDRFVRARFPNANPETAQWGYSSAAKDTWSLNSDQVYEWIKPEAGAAPTPTTFDFSELPNGTCTRSPTARFPGRSLTDCLL